MWIYLNDAMLSISQSPGYASNFKVVAHIAGDIERHFPDAAVRRGDCPEPRFYAFVDKQEFIKRMIDCMLDIEYPDLLQVIDPGLTRKAWYQATAAVARLAQTSEASVLSKMGPEDVALLDK